MTLSEFFSAHPAAGQVAHRQVDAGDVPLAGQLDVLLVLPGAAQAGAQPRQGAAPHAGAAQMPHGLSPLRPDEGGAGASAPRR